MRMYIFLMCLLIPAVAYAINFNLPIEVICEGKPIQAIGAIACAQKEYPTQLKVKIPPTKGTLRATDCNSDLTADGNPDDFNTQIEKVGWWIFARSVRVLSNTPTFAIPARSYNDCGITVSIAAEKTGVQTADVIFDSRMDGNFAEVTCGNKVYPLDRMGTCIALEDSQLIFTARVKDGTMIALAPTCGVSGRAELETQREIALRVPQGRCAIDLAWVTASGAKKSRILVIGKSREQRELDNPIMIREGDERRVFKPIGASIVSTEIYSGDKILWRSGERDQDSYHFDPKDDGGPWPTDAIACHTAYSPSLQSVSGVCYTLSNDREVPYQFK